MRLRNRGEAEDNPGPPQSGLCFAGWSVADGVFGRVSRPTPVIRGDLLIFIDDALAALGITVAFTTRVGGVSPSPYEALNLATHVGDDDRSVIENRRRLAVAIGLGETTLTFADQVHGRQVRWVDESLVGSGVAPGKPAIPDTDALVTKVPDTPLFILTADCLPIVLADPQAGIIAAVHAGWRGTLNKLVEATVEAMIEGGARVKNIHARLGPAIGPCCYEVGEDVYRRFAEEFQPAPGGVSGPVSVGTKGRLDLAAINESMLKKLGVNSDNIKNIGLCTSCHPELFYSWRRDGRTGRQGALIARFLTPGDQTIRGPTTGPGNQSQNPGGGRVSKRKPGLYLPGA